MHDVLLAGQLVYSITQRLQLVRSVVDHNISSITTTMFRALILIASLMGAVAFAPSGRVARSTRFIPQLLISHLIAFPPTL